MMTRIAVLVSLIIACHPDADRVQHPDGAQPRGTAQTGGSAAEAGHTAVVRTAVETPAAVSYADEESELAAKRWVYASFFNRLKRKVAQNWDPAALWHRIDPTAALYGTQTRQTEVRVSLSPDGQLTSIVVTRSSGISVLDDEGVRAFRAAAPFAPVPEGLIDKNGQIKFAFDFYFEIGPKHTPPSSRPPAVE